MCAAISLQGLLHHQAKLGPFNTEDIITFLDALHDAAVQDRPEQPRFVVVWDNVTVVSIGLLWSATGSPTVINLKSYTCPLTHHF